MQWQVTPYVLLLFIAGVSSFLWALYGIRSIRTRGRRSYLAAFVALCLTASIWSTVYAVQLAATTLEAKLLAYSLLHVGSLMVPPAWFLFALAYTDRSEWLTPPVIAGIAAIPLALLLALPTNPYSLALVDVALETRGSLTVLVTENGPLYLLHLAYSYVIVVLGAWYMGAYAVRSGTLIRQQAALLIVGVTVPLALNVSNVLAIPVVGTTSVNLTPVSIALSTALFGVAVFRYRMLDLTPIASRVVLTQMSDGVIVVDDRERIVDLNPSAEALVGDRDTVLGTDVSSNLEQYGDLELDGRTLLTLRDEDEADEDLQFRLSRSPLTKDGEVFGWVVLAVDVTVPERQRRQLEQKNERLDAFARVVSHDLGNSLSVIDGYTTLAEETGEPQYFDSVRQAAARMNTFLDDLLLLSQQGETVDEFNPVPIAALVEDVMQGIDDDSTVVRTETDSIVMADSNRLRQVFDNLLRNAGNHTEGDVTVYIDEIDGGFALEDDGPGIDPNMRESVFDLGVSTRESGSGFGLAIVRDIVEAHGWSISVTEGRSGGARFEITGVEFATND